MGIKDFFKIVYDPNGRTYAGLSNEIDLKSYAGKRIAVDAMFMIYSSFLAMKDWKSLTDDDGNPTIHIKTAVAQIAIFRSFSIEMIWIFDNRKLTTGKEAETEKRKLMKQKYNKPDQNQEIFEMKSQYIEEIMVLLEYCGIPYMEAPIDYEAEHIASILCQGANAVCDAVLTRDSDVFAFGAPVVITPERKATRGGAGKTKKKVYCEYKLADILNASAEEYNQSIYEMVKGIKSLDSENTELLKLVDDMEPSSTESQNTVPVPVKSVPVKITKTSKKTVKTTLVKKPRARTPKKTVGPITLEDLQIIGVILGNDFCDRTKGIGPGTVLWKYTDMKNSPKGVVLSDKQKFALNIYKSTVPVDELKKAFKNSDPDSDKFKTFLTRRKFNADNITKLMKQIFSS